MLALISPQISWAGTTTADFLEWERSSQDAFFQTAISMAAAIAAQSRPEIAQCVNDWYFADQTQQNSIHDQIVGVMPDYTTFHPTIVVLAIVEDACGPFKTS